MQSFLRKRLLHQDTSLLPFQKDFGFEYFKSVSGILSARSPGLQGQIIRTGHPNLTICANMGSSEQDAIDLTDENVADKFVTLSDSEDEDLKTAIALSLQSLSTESSPVPKITPLTYGIASLGRKQQEQERLARLKRKRNEPISPPVLNRAPLISPTTASSKRVIASVTAPIPTAKDSARTSQSTTPVALPYETGAVKKTWAFGYRRDHDVKLEEILQKSTLQAAVLSSFQWDMDWLFSKMETSRTKFVLVMQAKGEDIKDQYHRETASMPNLRLCFPSMEGQVNCMHSKLMLLFHPTFLRIVVPTANLVPYDWGEDGGFMENMLFIIDLPVRKPVTEHHVTPFQEELVSFLRVQDMYQDVLDRIELHDFSKTKDFAFVHTMGGSHYKPRMQTTGICGLRSAVKTLALDTRDGIQIDYITSSVGSLNTDFLRTIYRAAQGDDGHWGVGMSKKIKKDQELDSGWEKHFRCYFPSENTVKASKAGPAGAGTVCFQEDWWHKASFPRDIMRDCISVRPGMLMHNKIMYVRPIADAKADPTSLTPLGWAYLGSANLSESAW